MKGNVLAIFVYIAANFRIESNSGKTFEYSKFRIHNRIFVPSLMRAWIGPRQLAVSTSFSTVRPVCRLADFVAVCRSRSSRRQVFIIARPLPREGHALRTPF